MVKAFPEPIRELLVYHFCVLNSTPQFVLENIFLPNGAQIRTLQKLKARLKYMTNDDRAAYVEGGKQQNKRMLEEDSEELKFLEELMDGNRFMKIRDLTMKFYRDFFPNFPACNIIMYTRTLLQ